jgi:integrase
LLPTNDIRDIRTHHIEDFFDRLPNRLSMKTKDNVMTTLQSFVSWLVRKELLERRPQFPHITIPRPAAKWSTKAVLLKALPFVPEQDRAVIKFMLYHPLRSGEVCALKVKNFLLDKGIILIDHAFSRNVFRQRKNNKPYYLALSENFDKSLLKSKFPESWAFTNSLGNHYTSNHLKKIWRKACEKAGIEYIPLKNAGRTSIASEAVNRGESVYAVAGALGNSVEVVQKHYGHLRAESTRKIIDG